MWLKKAFDFLKNMLKKKKPSFAIVGAGKSENTQDLIKEIEKTSSSCQLIQPSGIYFHFLNGKCIPYYDKINLLDLDIFIFRGFNIHSTEAQLLAKALSNKGRIVIDEVIGKDFLMGKAHESLKLSLEKVLQPETFYMNNFNLNQDLLRRIPFPLLAKPVFGEQGRGIYKFDNKKTVCDFFKKNSGNYLLQKYFPIKEDYRVFIVGDKILGAIKRFVIEGDYRSNASLGARAEKFGVTLEMEKIALKATKAMGLEVAGVDLIERQGRWYVLEVNHTPQWQKFKEVTGINPAEEIINYALKKFEKKLGF